MDDVVEKEKKNETKNEKDIENIWTKECEELLAEWSEKASCYRWLHGRSEKNYRKWYYSFSIPVIILSTLTGAANVGMDSFVPQDSKSLASAIVGGVNIFAGIISTLQNFLKVAEYMEAHRIAGVSWGKLQRNIAIELALDPCRRVIQSDFLKLSRAEYDRLIEAGPIIDDSIILQFNKKFVNYQVSKPSICNGLDKCNIYKVDDSIKINHDDFKDGIEDIIKNDAVQNEITLADVKIKPSEKKGEKLENEDINLMKTLIDTNETDNNQTINKIIDENLLPSKNVIITKELFKDHIDNDQDDSNIQFGKDIQEEKDNNDEGDKNDDDVDEVDEDDEDGGRSEYEGGENINF